MKKKSRIILLIILALIFVIVAPIVTFYSLGWRIDIKTGKINQPGIFYFKVNPKNVQVFLDGKLKKKTDFFFGSLLIENLIAKKYEVTIKKEGFYDWQKILEIKNAQATEAKNIILIPKDPSFSILFKEINSLFFSPDQKKIIFEEQDELKLYEIEKDIKSRLTDKKEMLLKAGLDSEKTSIEKIDLIFSDNSKTTLLKAETNQKKTLYYLLEINKSPSYITYLDIKESIKKIDFNPENDKELFILSDDKESPNVLGKLNTENMNILNVLPESVLDYSILANSIFYLESSGIIFETDFSFNKHERVNNFQIPLEKGAEYKIIASPLAIIIKENSSIYYFDRNKNNLLKISDQVKDFNFSPNFKKLVYFNNYEIFVLFLEKENDQSQKEAGSQLFLTRFSEEIGKVFWYADYYLIFNVGDKIKIIETDDRDKINITDLASFKNPEIFWSQFEKKLYVLTEKTLFSSKKLIP